MRASGFIIIMLLMSLVYDASAQDRIYFRDAAPVEAVVKEIGDDYVLYKQWNNQSGPDYRASLSRVDRIVFANGSETVFRNGHGVSDAEDLMLSGAVIPGRLDYRHGRYYVGLSVVTPEKMMDYIGYTNYGSKYLKARRQYAAGFYLTCFGSLFTLMGIAGHVASGSQENVFPDSRFESSSSSGSKAYIAGYVLGAAGIAAGIPLIVSGNRKLDAIADDYNARHGYSLKAPRREKSLGLGQCMSGGVGLAFNF